MPQLFAITVGGSGGGGASASFVTIQTPFGTSPVATGSSDVLTFTSVDGSVTITGNAATDTIDLHASSSGGTASTTTTDTTNFHNILSNSDTDVQRALETIDSKSISTKTTTINSTPVTIGANDGYNVYKVTTTASRTINLPSCATQGTRCLTFFDVSGLGETNNVTFVPNGSDTINGINVAKTLYANYFSMSFYSDGVSNWSVK